METHRSTRNESTRMGQVGRAISSAACVAAFAVILAFGGPDADSSRWDTDIDAHSEVGHEFALDNDVNLGD